MMATLRAMALALAFSLAVPAVSGAQAADNAFKIGVVNLKMVVDSYDKSKDLKTRLEKDAETKKKQIENQEAALAKAVEDYKAKRPKMSDDDRYATEEKLASQRAEFEAEYKKLQGEINRTRDREVETIFGEVTKAIGEVGAAENYHLILESGESTTSGVLYFATPIDLTQRVLERVNSQYKKNK